MGPEIITKLENSFSTLTKNLENKNQVDLQETLHDQLKIKLDLDRLSGAMTLSQLKM